MKLLALELLLLLLLLSSACLLCPANSTASVLDRQADALLQWKSGLDGHGSCLNSWTKGTNTCNWTGIVCSTSDDAPGILSISLNSCGISGSLGKFWFAEFPHLQGLDLGNNSISGLIPSSIGRFVDLFDLDLSSNRFSGSIPTSLDGLGRWALQRSPPICTRFSAHSPDLTMEGKSRSATSPQNFGKGS
ncbi:probable leucine-rich repeat receptor-like protein kinase At1g68400 [Oryza glaberrima]|uniref:probable leucine-rich repeat receptor-like protein kinase At1g68400 n=1 Tax=Oryza glaberrima TaxID=4538 RepID=UPI00224BF52D|nr:probable leucine-rich repeat receptor-like protein kinase At1g68400 [Oryza glaberrima]